jgi:hypothetical protein
MARAGRSVYSGAAPMRRLTFISLLAALALALAGCGSGGGGGGAGNTGGVIEEGSSGGPVDTSSTLYQAAFGVCSSASPDEIKSNYRTTSVKPDAIADEVAANLAGGNPQEEPNAHAGCLAGLKAYGGG